MHLKLWLIFASPACFACFLLEREKLPALKIMNGNLLCIIPIFFRYENLKWPLHNDLNDSSFFLHALIFKFR